MPIYYEPIDSNTDVTTTRTLLHEVIPITGSIVSGTYADKNVKDYSHGMFQSVYDYPFLSSSANHIFDLTLGYDESSGLSGSANTLMRSKKINLYNQYSQVLLGYTGSANNVRKFENDLDLDGSGSMKEVFFVNFSRLITKDEIKKGSFSIKFSTGSWADTKVTAKAITLSDSGASATGGTANTVGGDYGILSGSGHPNAGVVFYQAGIAVISGSLFAGVAQFHSDSAGYKPFTNAAVSSSISGACDSLRRRLHNIQFNNTTEINSKIYFCRVSNNKFNYSANPTYLSSGKIRVKGDQRSRPPVSYITTIGLYNSDRELLAVAKLSEPLRKDPTNELTLRVRLDY